MTTQLARGQKIDQWWREADEGLHDENERIKENFRFYVGGDGQWDPETILALDEEGKPHLTINRCLPTINLISGYQRRMRQMIKVRPRKAMTAGMASVLTELDKHAMDTSLPNGDYALAEWFMMANIGAKWWIETDIDYSFDMLGGDIRVQAVSWADVKEDPLYRGYDINAEDPHHYNRYLFREYWLELDMIKLLYPQKSELIDNYGGKLGELSTDTGRVKIGPQMNRRSDYGHGSVYGSSATASHRTRRYLVKRCYWKKFQRQTVLYMTGTDKHWDMSERPGAARSLAKEVPNLEVFTRNKPVLHQADYLEEIELDYRVDPNKGNSRYPLERYCPYWTDGMPQGVIDNLKDPQREKNKRRSQILNHLNQSANSGFIGEEGSVDKERWREEASRSGTFLEYKKGTPKPEQIKPTPPSIGHIKMEQLADEDFEKITNQNSGMRGVKEGRTESGEALKTRREQGQLSNEVIFDNFERAELAFYQNLTEMVRRPGPSGYPVYSDEEIGRIVDEKKLNINPDDLRGLALGRYGLAIDRQNAEATVRVAEFYELLDLLKAVPNLAAETDVIDILEMSDIANAETIIGRIQQRRQQAQMAQQGRPPLMAGMAG